MKLIPEEIRINQVNSLQNLEFLRWNGAFNGVHSKLICLCASCGYEWKTTLHMLLHRGSKCPQCSGLRRWTAKERELQINSTENIKFVKWEENKAGAHSKATVRCEIDGFEWQASVNSIVNRGTGCPQCGGVRKWTKEDRIEQINSIDGIGLNKIIGRFVGDKTKIICDCHSCGISWQTSICSVVSHSSRCPSCACYGYKKSKDAVLYALLSECKSYVKVGISNDCKTRLATLKRRTPFSWDCIHKIKTSGSMAYNLESMLHDKYERAEFNGKFDGYTEWLVCTPDLLEEIRSIANGNSR